MNRRYAFFRTWAMLLGLLPVPAWPETVAQQIEVVAVHAGDSFDVRLGDRTVNVKIASIVAPVPTQPFHARARNTLKSFLEKRQLILTPATGQAGKYHVQSEGQDAASMLVRRGLAWVDRTAGTNNSLLGLEGKARALKRGIWHETWPLPPAEWAAGHRHFNYSQADLSGLVIADKRSRTFYSGACIAQQVPDEYRALFARPQDAIAAGYRKKRSCD